MENAIDDSPLPVDPTSEVKRTTPVPARHTPTPAPRPATPPPQAAPVAAAAEGFHPPTHVAPAVGRFTGVAPAPVAAKPSSAPAEQAPAFMNTQVRLAVAKVSGAGAAKRPPWVLIGGLAVALVLLVLFVVAAKSGGNGPQDKRTANLLADADKHRREEEARAALAAKPTTVVKDVDPLAASPRPQPLPEAPPDQPPAPQQTVAAAPGPVPPPPVQPPVPDLPPSPGASPSGSPAPGRQRHAGGGGRGGAAAKGASSSAAAEPAGPFQWSHSMASSAAPKAKKTLGVPLGAHIPVQLLSNLDSRTLTGAPIEATVTVAYLVDGDIALPVRTVLYGAGGTSGGRFTLKFTKARLPDNTVFDVDCVALDLGDKKAGLVATRRIQGAQQSGGSGLGEAIARGTANVAASAIPTANIAGHMAQQAASTAVNHPGSTESGGGGPQDAIMLDAPVNFVLVASKGF
jgi:hypothetical protein